MGFFTQYPYLNINDFNLDWILKSIRLLEKTMAEFVNANMIKFADPLQWSIDRNYEQSTVVIDNNGNAYISIDPVPAGIDISNEDYWLNIFNFDSYVEKANKNLTDNYFKNVRYPDRFIAVDSWVVLDDVLYKATADIDGYEPFVIGTNLIHFTVEEFLKDFVTEVTNTLTEYSNTIQQYKNDIDASEAAYRTQLAGDIADATDTLSSQFAAAIAAVTVDSEVIDARVGQNGVTYSSLGNAIRNQIKHVESDINAMSWPSKNILHLNNKTTSINSVTATVTNKNHIHLQGTAASSGGREVALSDYFRLKAGTYTMSTPIGDGTSFPRFYINNAADDSAIAFVALNTESITFTLPSNTTCYVSLIVISATDYDVDFDVMLESGSTMSPFELPVDAYDSVTSKGVHDLRRNVEYITQSEELGYLFRDGTWQGTTSYHSLVTNYIACDEGDMFYYKGRGQYDAQSYLLYNDLKEVVGYGQLSDGDYLTIPSAVGAMYVRFASFALISNPITPLYVERAKPKALADFANPLTHKVAVFDGDSICYGSGTDTAIYGRGYPGRIEVDNDMDSCVNLGVDGGTITAETYFPDSSPRHWICRNIANISSTYPDADYIIIEGGVNDADLIYNGTIALGTFSETDFTGPFNDTTFYGAMDSLCKSLLEYFPYKKLGFIIVHKMGVGATPLVNNRKTVMGYIKKVCEKWGLPVIDLWKDGQLRPDVITMFDPDYTTIIAATNNGKAYYAGGHLTKYGYDIIAPKIGAFMKTL